MAVTTSNFRKLEIPSAVRSIMFLGVCASVMYSFSYFYGGEFILQVPQDALPLFFCLLFTVLVDLLYRKNEKIVPRFFTYFEILIAVMAGFAGRIVYGSEILPFVVILYVIIVSGVKFIGLCALFCEDLLFRWDERRKELAGEKNDINL